MPNTVGYSRNSLISRRMAKKHRERFEKSHTRFQQGKFYRQLMREEAWRASYNQYMNQIGWENNEDPTADVLNIPVSFSTINTLVPLVSDENPSFIVEAYSGDSNAEHASVLQAFLNRLWQSDDIQGQVHLTDVVFDYLVYGDGVARVNYKIEPIVTYGSNGEPITKPGYDKAIFSVERINPWDFWLDPSADGLHNARWVCVRKMYTVDELNNDDRFKLLDDLEAGNVIFDGQEQNNEDRYMADDFVAVYEFYDTVERYMMAFLEQADAPIRYIEYIDPPIVQMSNYRIPNCPYHMGELEMISSLQHELNKNRSEMITHRRRNTLKWAVREHFLPAESREALQSGRVGDIVAVEGDWPIQDAIVPLDPQPISADNYNLDAQIRGDINEITGVNDYLRGQPQEVRRSATEASIIEGATNIRTRHKLYQVEEAAKDIGQLLLDIVSDVLPETEFEEMRMYITGREAERLMRTTQPSPMGDAPEPGALGGVNTDVILTPTPEIFNGKYVVFVERGSIELRNPQVKAAKYKEMYNVLATSMPILMQTGTYVNLKKVLELWFEAEGIEDVDALFEIDEEQGAAAELAAMQQAGMLPGGGQPGITAGNNGNGPSGGAPTPPGQPRPESTNAPSAPVSPENSGMLGPANV